MGSSPNQSEKANDPTWAFAKSSDDDLLREQQVKFQVTSRRTFQVVFTGGKQNVGTMRIEDDGLVFTGQMGAEARTSVRVADRLFHSLINPLELLMVPLELIDNPKTTQFKFLFEKTEVYFDDKLQRLYLPLNEAKHLNVVVTSLSRERFDALVALLRKKLGSRMAVAPRKLGRQMWLAIAYAVFCLILAIALYMAARHNL